MDEQTTPCKLLISYPMFNNTSLNELEVAYFTTFNANGTTVGKYLTARNAQIEAKKKGFDSSVKMWKYTKALWEAFNSDEEKARREEAGIVMTSSDFSKKVLGYSDKSQKNLAVRLATRVEEHPELLTAYKREQTRKANNGEKAPRSAQDFDKWSRAVLEQEAKGATQEEAVEAVAEATAEATSNAPSAVFQVQFFGAMQSRATLNEDGTLTLDGCTQEELVRMMNDAVALVASAPLAS